MTFEASTINDIDSIFQFYDMAVEYQKTKFNKHWKGFERDLVEKEISENRQWKIIINNEIACVFAITFEDENIWKEKNDIIFSNFFNPFCKWIKFFIRNIKYKIFGS